MTTQAARAIEDALDQLEPRDRHVFGTRTLLLRRDEHGQPSATYGPLTLEDFGRVYGAPREHVRGWQRRAEKNLRRQLDDDLAVRELVATLRDRLGERFPLSTSELAALVQSGSRMGDDAREEIRRVAVWRAGFKLTVKGPDGQWVDITRTPNGFATADRGGVRRASGADVWRQVDDPDAAKMPRFMAQHALATARWGKASIFWIATTGIAAHPATQLPQLRGAVESQRWIGHALALACHPAATALGIAPIPHGEGTFEWPASLGPDPMTVKRPDVEGEVWALRAGVTSSAD